MYSISGPTYLIDKEHTLRSTLVFNICSKRELAAVLQPSAARVKVPMQGNITSRFVLRRRLRVYSRARGTSGDLVLCYKASKACTFDY